MKHLKPFNENKENLVEEVQDFCNNSLAYLLDEGYDISISLRDKVYSRGVKISDKQHLIVSLGLPANSEGYFKLFSWNDVKDSYIPFIQMLVRRYELLPYNSNAHVYFNTEMGLKYLSLEQVINDEIATDFGCRLWGINIQILDKKI